MYLNNHPKGFTLMETLTAMMILVISLTVLFQVFSGGLNSVRLSESYTRAIYHAREKMEMILLQSVLSDDMLEGHFEDGCDWKVEIRSMEDKPVGIQKLTLFQIAVSVFWQENLKQRKIVLDSIHLARKIENKRSSF